MTTSKIQLEIMCIAETRLAEDIFKTKESLLYGEKTRRVRKVDVL